MSITLSKSRLLAFRQCPRRFWLEVHRPDLREDSEQSERAYATGNRVGEVAQSIYSDGQPYIVIDRVSGDLWQALETSRDALKTRQVLFEAGVAAAGAMAFADIMLPEDNEAVGWRMVEVKSSTRVKEYHLDDASVQAYAFRAAGIPVTSVAIAHIDTEWIYPGGGDYRGLLREEDVTEVAFGRHSEVAQWVNDARLVLAGESEPGIKPGAQCNTPFDCPFLGHCRPAVEITAECPVQWIPRKRSVGFQSALDSGATDMREIDDEHLNDIQQRVKHATVTGQPYFDAAGAKKALQDHRWPALFLDFETVQHDIPCWKGRSPYQQVPFQFSVHILSEDGKLEHREFLDLSGEDPAFPCAQALIDACGDTGTIYAWYATFESTRISELASQFPALANALNAIRERMVDLLPIARRCYYHPGQKGSWSIKAVLPTIAQDLDYAILDGVKDGGMAMDAYHEAVDAACDPERRAAIRQQLLKYCGLDTYGLVEVFNFFRG